ncbi:MAG: hypothetical protein WC437_04645 [Patescibacteria group bacterium]|jgi:uncharacterized protein YjbI with pentapeptide repeats
MAVTLIPYTYYTKYTLDGTDIDLANDTIKLALYTSSSNAASARDTAEFIDDVTNEWSDASYDSGGYELTCSLTLDAANHRTKFDATDFSQGDLTGTNLRYAVIYKDTGTPGTSPVIAYIDFGENITFSNATLSITFASAGIFLNTAS